MENTRKTLKYIKINYYYIRSFLIIQSYYHICVKIKQFLQLYLIHIIYSEKIKNRKLCIAPIFSSSCM